MADVYESVRGGQRFATSDFPTIVVLTLRKHRLAFVDRANPRRAVFEFLETPELRGDVEKLRSRQLLVDPFEFWFTERVCKQQLHEDTQP